MFGIGIRTFLEAEFLQYRLDVGVQPDGPADHCAVGFYIHAVDAEVAKHVARDIEFAFSEPRHRNSIGQSPGNAAATMAQAGLTVEATDASAAMVSLANKHTGVTATQAVFDDIASSAVYDGIWANFSLLHAARADFPIHLNAVHKALKPGGAFYIGMKLGTGQGPDRIGRFYTYYSQEELEDHMTQAGFTITDRTLGNGVGLDGKPSDWIAVNAHA